MYLGCVAEAGKLKRRVLHSLWQYKREISVQVRTGSDGGALNDDTNTYYRNSLFINDYATDL